MASAVSPSYASQTHSHCCKGLHTTHPLRQGSALERLHRRHTRVCTDAQTPVNLEDLVLLASRRCTCDYFGGLLIGDGTVSESGVSCETYQRTFHGCRVSSSKIERYASAEAVGRREYQLYRAHKSVRNHPLMGWPYCTIYCFISATAATAGLGRVIQSCSALRKSSIHVRDKLVEIWPVTIWLVAAYAPNTLLLPQFCSH